MNEEVLLMWLSRVDIANVRQAKELLKRFRTAQRIWEADKDELLETPKVTKTYVEKLIQSKNESFIDEWLSELADKRIKFISIKNKKYPEMLKQIYNPPIGLYVCGTLPDEEKIKVAIVGARRSTYYGEEVTVKLSRELAEKGFVIVSGMATGIDSYAHKGALQAKGSTIAVLGCGVDICYPKNNMQLMNEIREKGCILSEYPPGVGPEKSHFPHRNRIISGLSAAVILTEAGEKSGSGITATLALEQGREVGAVPGSILSSNSKKTNALIQEGAALIKDTWDVLDMLGITYNKEEINIEKKILFSVESVKLEGNEELVYSKIDSEPVSADEIVRTSGLSIQEINSTLTMLELKKLIQKNGMQRYTRDR